MPLALAHLSNTPAQTHTYSRRLKPSLCKLCLKCSVMLLKIICQRFLICVYSRRATLLCCCWLQLLVMDVSVYLISKSFLRRDPQVGLKYQLFSHEELRVHLLRPTPLMNKLATQTVKSRRQRERESWCMAVDCVSSNTAGLVRVRSFNYADVTHRVFISHVCRLRRKITRNIFCLSSQWDMRWAASTSSVIHEKVCWQRQTWH